MLRFNDYLLENKIEKKAYFVGNCKNSFDDDGDCTTRELPYRDTTDFAQGEEKSKKVSRENFEKNVTVPEHLKKLHNSPARVEHLHDKENDVHMMYDKGSDTHHFFVK